MNPNVFKAALADLMAGKEQSVFPRRGVDMTRVKDWPAQLTESKNRIERLTLIEKHQRKALQSRVTVYLKRLDVLRQKDMDKLESQLSEAEREQSELAAQPVLKPRLPLAAPADQLLACLAPAGTIKPTGAAQYMVPPCWWPAAPLAPLAPLDVGPSLGHWVV